MKVEDVTDMFYRNVSKILSLRYK